MIVLFLFCLLFCYYFVGGFFFFWGGGGGGLDNVIEAKFQKYLETFVIVLLFPRLVHGHCRNQQSYTSSSIEMPLLAPLSKVYKFKTGQTFPVL